MVILLQLFYGKIRRLNILTSNLPIITVFSVMFEDVKINKKNGVYLFNL